MDLRTAERLFLKQLDRAGVYKRLERRAARTGMKKQIVAWDALKGAELLKDRGLPRRAQPLGLAHRRGLLRLNGEPDHFKGLILGAAPPIFVEPEARRQHGAHRVIDRTEKALTHKERKFDLLLRQNRLLIQQGEDSLELLVVAAVIRDGEDDALASAVAAGKRDVNAHTGSGALGKLVRDQIVIGLVKPVCCGRDRDFRNHPGHARFSSRAVIVSVNNQRSMLSLPV